MKWFKHDSDARHDAKLQKLMMRHGLEGYGLYFYCLEIVASAIDKDKLTFELEHDAEIIAYHTKLHVEDVQNMMTYMVELGLFENDHGIVTCLTMARRLDQSMTSNPRMRQLIQQSKESHDGVMIPSDKVMQDKTRLDKNRIKDKAEPSVKRDAIPYQLIVDAYHDILPTLRKCQKLTAQRKANIRQRWNEDLKEIEHWVNYFEYVKTSDFLMGKSKTSNDRPFCADLEWLIKAGNFVKVSEDKYHGI